LGLLISIALAMLIVIAETAFPHTAMLGRIEKTTVYRWVVCPMPGVCVLGGGGGCGGECAGRPSLGTGSGDKSMIGTYQQEIHGTCHICPFVHAFSRHCVGFEHACVRVVVCCSQAS
jgi:hypothetical protein